MEIKEITGDNFQTEVTKAAQPVLLEFYADGCSFCKAQLSVLEEAAEEACDVKFVRVNGDKERTLAGLRSDCTADHADHEWRTDIPEDHRISVFGSDPVLSGNVKCERPEKDAFCPVFRYV